MPLTKSKSLRVIQIGDRLPVGDLPDLGLIDDHHQATISRMGTALPTATHIQMVAATMMGQIAHGPVCSRQSEAVKLRHPGRATTSQMSTLAQP